MDVSKSEIMKLRTQELVNKTTPILSKSLLSMHSHFKNKSQTFARRDLPAGPSIQSVTVNSPPFS